MTVTAQLSKNLRDVHFGGNWTCSNLKEQLADVTWQEATKQVYSCNSIATLTFHVNYFVCAAMKVLQGGPLDAHDKFSFDHPPILCQKDWETFLEKIWNNAEIFAQLIKQLDDSNLSEHFTDEKYGSYYRNISGIIEHMHYHLGQIAILKKIIRLAN
ncbi:DUF1572 domain-containing protein [Flavobacterium phycosphaerae]|uniref:DUF1572 domain-containing protein n=1 Tax=Flavobacterium phycosphaerae TaxID=2697515 RepID=UPI00138A5CD0|nr:DUF1572 domain-containing protein [Flavobacterium phycosphaerae]